MGASTMERVPYALNHCWFAHCQLDWIAATDTGNVFVGTYIHAAIEVVTTEGKIDIPLIRPIARMRYHDFTSVPKVIEPKVPSASAMRGARMVGLGMGASGSRGNAASTYAREKLPRERVETLRVL